MNFPRLRVPLGTAFALFLAAAPLAASEQHTLYSYNGWKVDLVVREDSSLACVAGTLNERDDLFAVRIDPMSDVSVHLVFRNPDTGVKPLKISIQGITDWQLEEFETFFFGGSFTFRQHETGQDFLEDLKKGRTLSVSSPMSEQVFARFLIEGSAPALASLGNCFALIRGPGL